MSEPLNWASRSEPEARNREPASPVEINGAAGQDRTVDLSLTKAAQETKISFYLQKLATTLALPYPQLFPSQPRTRLIVEDTPDGVLLQLSPTFAPSLVDTVFGSLKAKGAAMSIEQMDAVVREEAKRRARAPSSASTRTWPNRP